MKKRISKWMMAGLLLLAPLVTLAQETNAVEAVSGSVTDVVETLAVEPVAELQEPQLDLNQLVEQGGFLIYLLFAMSIGGVALVVMFFFTLNGGRVTPAQFVQDVLVMMRHGRFDEARKRCERNNSPAAAIGIAALDYMTVPEDTDPEDTA